MKKVILLLKKATHTYIKAESELDLALKEWLKPFNFPSYIVDNFWITFASGGENIVHYGNDEWAYGGVSDIPLERLLTFTKEQVIDYFELE